MSDVDHSLLMTLRDFIRPIVYEVVREVVREELAARPASTAEPSEYLSIKHASARYDIPEGTLRNWLKRGQLRAFPRLVSYQRFVELMPSALVPLCGYLQSRKGRCSGISFIDSTSLKVCHNRRTHSHKVFAGAARRGRTSVDWFFGFKLHLVINDRGELLALRLTPGNTDDRWPVSELVKGLFGKLFGDKGYVSGPLFEALYDEGVQLVTKLKRGMKNRLIPLLDKIMLRKRAVIESVMDQLKNVSQIEHSRHRSVANCFVNLLGGLVAYTWREKKPSLNIRVKEQLQLIF